MTDLFDGCDFEAMRRMACGHPETTPEDGTGAAICVACGAVVVVRLTLERFTAAAKAVLRR